MAHVPEPFFRASNSFRCRPRHGSAIHLTQQARQVIVMTQPGMHANQLTHSTVNQRLGLRSIRRSMFTPCLLPSLNSPRKIASAVLRQAKIRQNRNSVGGGWMGIYIAL